MCMDERCRHPYTCDCEEQCADPKEKKRPDYLDTQPEALHEHFTPEEE